MSIEFEKGKSRDGEAMGSMKKLKQKLRSRRGASITFALLIFLVCAIISGVVIVAASTAGGRMSGMRESDQRYFAATAAAHTLQDIFDGKTVEVTYNPANPAGTASANVTNAILKEASEAVIKGTNFSKTIGEITGPADSAESYKCNITPRLVNGLMYFDIKVQGGSNINSGVYTLTIVFSSNVKKPGTAGSSGNAKATVTWTLNSLSRS